jgi:pimeloyl-ACP methyl ester carboxylesterase
VRQGWVIRRTVENVYLDKTAITDKLVAEIQSPAYEQGALDVFTSVFSTPQEEKVDVLLKRLTYPLLLFWGEADPWMKARERSQKFHQYDSQLTEYFLTDGHYPHDEAPEPVNPILRD